MIRHYLRPGEFLISSEPTVVTTVLGSCVAVTIHVPRLGMAGICHALLPGDGATTLDNPARYVDTSVHAMVEALSDSGARKGEMVVKLFGGADVLDTLSTPHGTVGMANVKRAQNVLHEAGLPLAAIETGGTQGRKLHFFTHTGEVFLKKIGNGCERVNE